MFFRMLLALLLCAASSALAGGGHTLTVSAVVVSNNSCRFLTAASTLNIGAIDPAGTAARSASTNIRIRCTGSGLFATWGISNNSGLYGLGSNALRMRHATVPGEYMAYSLTYPTSGTAFWIIPQTITITATVAAADYQNARPGAYSDTVILSLLP
jgi:hypothetical protein